MHRHADCFLVVGEQAALRAAIARILLPLGYRVEIASSEKRARELISQRRFAAAVVALAGMPTQREIAFLIALKGAIPKLAVLTDGGSAAKRISAALPDTMVCGSKPLEHEKLLVFLSEPALQGSHHVDTEHLHFAGCTIDVSGCIFRNTEQQEVPLTRGEFALLVAFARNHARVLSRHQLRNAMGGGSAEAYDRSIDMLVARLRRKVEPNPNKPELILTVPGVGYKFIPHVRRGKAAMVAASEAGEISGEGEAPRAERRQITVLSCQVIGFAALAAKLDPEDLDRTIGPVYATCAGVVNRFGGTIVRTLGDSMLTYFGYPSAHENDAPRAVRAALELLRAVSAIKAAPIGNFRARIGLATGLMLVGELRSVGSRGVEGVGEALNLALHMQKAASADSVVIAASTRRLIGRFFHCRKIASVELEEGSGRVPAWQIIEEITGMPRFEALHRDGMLDFVGRETELERLRQCWSKALLGSGQVVLLTGEAGIGKSRLVLELQERLRGETHAVVRYSGSQHRADAPMSVLVDELQAAAGFATGDDTAHKVAKLQRQFAPLGRDAAEAAALGCMLLNLPFDASTQVSQQSPQKRKERTFATLLARIEMMAAQQPVCAVVEDAHWLDPTSLDFFALLVERARGMRLLLVLVARSEFVPPWPEHAHMTTLALPRLSRADSTQLIEEAAGQRCVPRAIADDIIARADGVPLFVEELTKSVLEHAAHSDGGSPPGSAGAATTPIPISLHALLLARLDRLDRGKAVAQAGAVIGREFSVELLREITGVDDRTLSGALDQLVSSGLVFRRGLPQQATFIFKHALVRDAAYGMLVRNRRQRLHGSVAQAYETHFPEIVEAQPELLAYHHREAENSLKAIDYLIIAADRALKRSATTAALSHLALARELLAKLPESGERSQLELKLETTQARTLLARSGYTAPETRAAYQRARQCCEAVGDQAFLPLTMHGQWVCAWVAGDYPSALQAAQQLYIWGERNHEPVGLAVAHSDLGLTLTTLGQFNEALRHLEHALRINKFSLSGRQPFVASAADGRISTLSFMQHCLLLLGFPDQARAAANEAVALQPDNLYSRALAQTRLVRMHVFARDAVASAAAGFELLRLAEEQGYPYFVGTASVYVGWALAQRGEIGRGIELCQKGLAQLRAIDAKSWMTFYLALLAECYEQAEDDKRAMQAIAEAFAIADATGERVWQAELLRLKGRLLHSRGDTASAQANFIEALRTARQQKAKLLELRASTSLATLLIDKQESMQARELLAPVHASFEEGFDFIDLREAEALLHSPPSTSLNSPPGGGPKAPA